MLMADPILAKRTRDDEAGVRLSSFVSERIPWGVVTLDAKGCIVAMNRQAERITATRDGLVVDKGHLLALRSAENRALQGLVAEVITASAGASPHRGGAIQIPRTSGQPGYVVQVLPVSDGATSLMRGAVLYIADPTASLNLDVRVLIAAFKLSARQASLAVLLADGASLAEAADRLEISYYTARLHIQQVFRKTATCSQTGLIRLLSRLIGSEAAGDQVTVPMNVASAAVSAGAPSRRRSSAPCR
jgi:DNA-binding CsgD family transcriptional regulator